MKDDLGYGLLLKRYTPNVADASEAQIQQAVKDSFPKVGPMFWSFRIMVGCGVIMLGVFILAFYYNAHRIIEQKRWLLWAAVLSIPLPWIAIEFGLIMVGCGVIMLGVFILSFYYNAHRIIEQKRWLLWAAVLMKD